MDTTVAREIAELPGLTVTQLKERYAVAFGEATKANHRGWLVKRIAWRLQERAEGGLSERARRRAAELADDADLRLSPPRLKLVSVTETATKVIEARSDGRLPPPGSVLTRRYKGEDVQVKVLARGFEYDGEVYPSLSAVAKAVTGSHCNGFLFFKLTAKETSR